MREGAMNGATEAEKKAAEDNRKKEGPLSIEEVLAAEAGVIRGTDRLADELLKDLVAAQDANAKAAIAKAANAKDANDLQFARYRMDDDQRSGEDLPDNEVQARKAFYRALNALNRAALC